MISPVCLLSLKIVRFNSGDVFVRCVRIVAQEAARPDRGAAMNRNYLVSDVENINLQNGNVNLSIPLASLPPIAGGKLSWTISANYNSKIWDVVKVQEEPLGAVFLPYVVDVPCRVGAGPSAARTRSFFAMRSMTLIAFSTTQIAVSRRVSGIC